MKHKIGIILPHLGVNQTSFLAINQINSFISRNKNVCDFVIFYENNSAICVRPLCAMMNMNEMWAFNGVLISTNIDNAIASSKVINNAKNIFYIWDLEWLRNKKDIFYNNLAYNNENITLMARSWSHAKAVRRYCGREIEIINPNFNMENIVNEFCK